MTPYEALYHHKPSFGLSDFGVPEEYTSDIHTEEDLDALIEEINSPSIYNLLPSAIPTHSNISLITGSKFSTNSYEVEVCSIQSPVLDSYLDDISQPIPDGTRVFGSNFSHTKTHSTLNCVVCNYATSGVHSCPGCSGFVHVYCGRTEGEESYGSPFWCAKCDLANTAKQANNVRVGIKRNQEKLHDRMISSAAKKFQPAAMGDNVVVPIERPDKMHSLGPRNMLGIVTDISEDIYTIGTRNGTLNTNYTRNQFEICSSNTFIQPSNVPEAIISQTSAMRKASLGIEKNSFCRCKHCKTTRCPCKKSSRRCGTMILIKSCVWLLSECIFEWNGSHYRPVEDLEC